MEKKPLILNEKEKTNENIITKYNKNKVASCKQIAAIYKEQKKDNISPSTVYRILINNWIFALGRSFKTNKLPLINSTKQTFFVLKIIIRTINLGGEIVYLDEWGFYKNNDNLRMWRKIGQDVYYEIGYNTKTNLLLAVTPSKVLHYKLSYQVRNSTNFESFMTEMIQKLTPEEKRNYIFFLDNCSSHGTMEQ